MLKGNYILKIGAIILAILLIVSHSVGFNEMFTSFFMGLGCSLSLFASENILLKCEPNKQAINRAKRLYNMNMGII